MHSLCPRLSQKQICHFLRNIRDWVQSKLPGRQLPMQPLAKISSKCWHYRFSDGRCTYMNRTLYNVVGNFVAIHTNPLLFVLPPAIPTAPAMVNCNEIDKDIQFGNTLPLRPIFFKIRSIFSKLLIIDTPDTRTNTKHGLRTVQVLYYWPIGRFYIWHFVPNILLWSILCKTVGLPSSTGESERTARRQFHSPTLHCFRGRLCEVAAGRGPLKQSRWPESNWTLPLRSVGVAPSLGRFWLVFTALKLRYVLRRHIILSDSDGNQGLLDCLTVYPGFGGSAK